MNKFEIAGTIPTKLHRYHDHIYLDAIIDVYKTGRQKKDRTGVGTRSKFGIDMRFDITHNIIPVLTSKSIHLPSLTYELKWYLKGDTNTKYLVENGIRIWNEWADENGDLGPVYGAQWRKWPGPVKSDYAGRTNRPGHITNISGHGESFEYFQEPIDQIANLIHDLAHNPDSRRLIVSAWNVSQLAEMKLPPCHAFFQFYTEEMTIDERREWAINELTEFNNLLALGCQHEQLDELKVPRRWISCKLTQRSADMFLGVPFNIAQYSMLTAVIGKVVNMAPREFIWSGGDCHIYDNHVEQVMQQLRNPISYSPRLIVNSELTNIDDFQPSDLALMDYHRGPVIKAKVAV